jgi:hypothetical protein
MNANIACARRFTPAVKLMGFRCTNVEAGGHDVVPHHHEAAVGAEADARDLQLTGTHGIERAAQEVAAADRHEGLPFEDDLLGFHVDDAQVEGRPSVVVLPDGQADERRTVGRQHRLHAAARHVNLVDVARPLRHRPPFDSGRAQGRVREERDAPRVLREGRGHGALRVDLEQQAQPVAREHRDGRLILREDVAPVAADAD